MQTLDITGWWLHTTPSILRNISGSQAEHGPLAGEITWANAMASTDHMPALNDDQAQELRDYFASYGAWDEAEITAWPEKHLRAMLAQELAASARLWDISGATRRDEWPEWRRERDGFTRREWQVVYDREGPPLMEVHKWDEATGYPLHVSFTISAI